MAATIFPLGNITSRVWACTARVSHPTPLYWNLCIDHIFPTSREQRNIVQLCTDFFAPFKQNRSSILYLIKSTWSDFFFSKTLAVTNFTCVNFLLKIIGSFNMNYRKLCSKLLTFEEHVSLHRDFVCGFVDPSPSEWVSEQRCKLWQMSLKVGFSSVHTEQAVAACSLAFTWCKSKTQKSPRYIWSKN